MFARGCVRSVRSWRDSAVTAVRVPVSSGPSAVRHGISRHGSPGEVSRVIASRRSAVHGSPVAARHGSLSRVVVKLWHGRLGLVGQVVTWRCLTRRRSYGSAGSRAARRDWSCFGSLVGVPQVVARHGWVDQGSAWPSSRGIARLGQARSVPVRLISAARGTARQSWSRKARHVGASRGLLGSVRQSWWGLARSGQLRFVAIRQSRLGKVRFASVARGVARRRSLGQAGLVTAW